MVTEPGDLTGRCSALKRCYGAALLAGLMMMSGMKAIAADSQMEGQQDGIKPTLANKNFQQALTELKGIDPSRTRIAYLVFDHKALNWSCYHSRPPAGPGDIQEDTSDKLIGPDGNPRILRSGKERLVLVVEKTNPFLYSYEGKVSPPQESPDATAMRTALNAIRGAIAAVVGETEKQPQQTSLQAQASETLRNKREDLIADLKNLVRIQEEVQLYVQALEAGVGDRPDAPSPKGVLDSAEKGLKALSAFETSAQAWDERLCYQTWLPLLRLVGLPSINDEDLVAARAGMVKARDLSQARITPDPPCARLAKEPFLILDRLQAIESATFRAIILPIRLCIEKKAWEALDIDRVLSAKKDFFTAAAQLDAFAQLGRTQALRPESGGYWSWQGHGTVAVMVPPFPDQTWLQDNPGTLSIKSETSVYAECIRLRQTGVERKFLLSSRRQAFLGVGFGLTLCTNLKDPTYGLVSVADATKADGTAYVVARTSEESRKGTLIAMIFLRPRAFLTRTAQPWPVEPGIEVGASLDTKKPGLYFGPSLEIFRFLRIGVGGTWQVINSLAEGVHEAEFNPDGTWKAGSGTELDSSSAVRTRKTGVFRFYVGLTFALDALPLFAPSK